MMPSVDLMPRERAERRRVIRTVLRWTTVVVICEIAVASVGIGLRVRASRLAPDVAALRDNVQTMQSWENMVFPMLGKLQAASEQRRITRELIAEPAWSDLLSDLANAAEDDLRITRFTVFRTIRKLDRGKAGTGQKGEPESVLELSISGEARSNEVVMRFIKRLPQSHQIKTIKLTKSEIRQIDQETAVVNFDVSGMITADAAEAGLEQAPERQNR